MILQVYDELVFDVYKLEFDIIKLIIEEYMVNVIFNFNVFILVEMGEGKNWWEVY